MAARPNPLSALKLVTRLAHNSKRRLDVSVENTKAALENNVRLTPAERKHYEECIACAKELAENFDMLSEAKLPKAPPRVPRKVGRPSQKEIARAEALRRG